MKTQPEKEPSRDTHRQSGTIHLDDRGVAWIEGTRTKVIEVVLDHVACEWSPSDIHEHHPHLSPAQIKSALDYYEEHRAAIDAEIERRYAQVEEMRSQATRQFTRDELEARLREHQKKQTPA